MDQVAAELIQVRDLLTEEKQEDLRQFRTRVLDAPVQERVQAGLSWYPVEILSEEFGPGGSLRVDIERRNRTGSAHNFNSGSVAAIFAPDHQGEPCTGVIGRSTADKVVFFPYAGNLPDWVSDAEHLGLDLYFDERSYFEMEFSLNRVIEASQNRLADLRDVLLGQMKPRFREQVPPNLPRLNPSQQEAIGKVMAANDLALIHGPPGTGKTTTLIEAIRLTLHSEKQVLACAPSNAAADLIAERLVAMDIDVVRIGHPARVTPRLSPHLLDEKVLGHPSAKDLKNLWRDAREVRSKALKYRRKFGKEEREMRRELLKESKLIREAAKSMEDYILKDVLDRAGAIVCTLVGAANEILRERSFSTLFIDEAGQALEPACWIPVRKANRIVLAGDHFQLPPTIKSKAAAKGGLETTLFEKCIERHPEAGTMLTVQYRMNRKIMEFSNRQFYEGRLEAHESVAEHTIPAKEEIEAPVEFIDTAGCGFPEEQDPETLSRLNPEEGRTLLKRLNQLLESDPEGSFSIGIIAPYRAQVNFLRGAMKEFPALVDADERITVHTVDSFQGQERDLIAISLTRSNEKSEVGFLSDTRRMNVAMTRARKKLILMGDSATLGSHPFYAAFLDYVDEIGAYTSAWEWMG